MGSIPVSGIDILIWIEYISIMNTKFWDITAASFVLLFFGVLIYMMITDTHHERCEKANGTYLKTGDRNICVAIQNGKIVELKDY